MRRLFLSAGFGGVHIVFVADGWQNQPLFRSAVQLLCALYVSLFCVSFFHVGIFCMVFCTKSGALRHVLLCGAAYGSFFRCGERCGVAVDAAGAGSVSYGYAAVKPGHPRNFMGGFCPQRIDG